MDTDKNEKIGDSIKFDKITILRVEWDQYVGPNIVYKDDDAIHHENPICY